MLLTEPERSHRRLQLLCIHRRYEVLIFSFFPSNFHLKLQSYLELNWYECACICECLDQLLLAVRTDEKMATKLIIDTERQSKYLRNVLYLLPFWSDQIQG